MTDTIPEFLITRRFAAPIEQVFDAWADPDKMVEWSGPTGSKAEIVEGRIAEGERSISRTTGEGYPEMYSLMVWREIRPPSRIAWEQSFCDPQGNKIGAPFFDHWPLTLLTTVDFVAQGDETVVTLSWKPIEGTPEGFAEFASQMASMTGGWSGSFDKLDAFLAGA